MWTAIPCERLLDTEEACRNYDVIGIDEGQFVWFIYIAYEDPLISNHYSIYYSFQT